MAEYAEISWGDAPPRAWRRAFQGLPIPAWRWYARVPSTQDAAWAWVAQGAVEGVLVAAREQTAGRGRAGRRWFAAADASLALSVVARPFQDETPWLSRYTAWAALAMAEALAAWGLDVQLKWPNDLWLCGHKVGGVLVEVRWSAARVEAAVLGVGVNLRPEAVPPRDWLDVPAGSLAELAGVSISAPQLAAAFWRAWARWRVHLPTRAWVRAWEARLAFRGRRVRVTSQGRTWLGVLQGLSPQGALVVRTAQGMRTFWHIDRLRLAEPDEGRADPPCS
ncbi:MAG: biotin--[acetyl-CoA-carboxylase] ligase [Chloroflexi bacterium]|nr:biotin--[acetyl-CoA-carboxylase] ligase [Chloroflexota bacterium]